MWLDYISSAWVWTVDWRQTKVVLLLCTQRASYVRDVTVNFFILLWTQNCIIYQILFDDAEKTMWLRPPTGDATAAEVVDSAFIFMILTRMSNLSYQDTDFFCSFFGCWNWVQFFQNHAWNTSPTQRSMHTYRPHFQWRWLPRKT